MRDTAGGLQVIHSLNKYSYLKLDVCNSLNYECLENNESVITVENEWSTKGYIEAKLKNEGHADYKKLMKRDNVIRSQISTNFENIYSIRVVRPTLAQIMIIKSFYKTTQIGDILKLIKM